MSRTDLLTLFKCLVPLTWLLFLPAFAVALSVRDSRQVAVVLLLSIAAAALAVVTIDSIGAGVW